MFRSTTLASEVEGRGTEGNQGSIEPGARDLPCRDESTLCEEHVPYRSASPYDAAVLLPPAKLALSFESPDRRYAVGSVVRGRVDVSSSSGFTCNNIVVTLHWATHGKGDVDKGEGDTDVLAHGVAIPAGTTSFPFIVTIPPEAAPTYRGRVVNLDWYVTARADVSLAIDPKVTEDVVVFAPLPKTPNEPTVGIFLELAHHSKHVPRPALTPSPSGRGIVLSHGTTAAIGSVFLIGPALYFALFFDRFGGLAVMAGFFAFVGITMLTSSIPKLLAAAALRALTVHVGPLSRAGFLRGGPLACVVFARGARGKHIKGVTLHLAAKERTERKRGTSTEVHTEIHVVSKATIRDVHVRSRGGGAYRGAPPPNESPLFAGAPDAPEEGCAEYRHVFQIPPNAPTTFETTNNSVRWVMRVVVEIEGAPDWDEEYPLGEVR